MGLLSALSNAVSGLNANQQNLNVLSHNISNANTPNYSREVANQQAAYDNGLGVGVSIKDITRTVDSFLNAEVQGQTSINSSASAIQSYYTQIQNLLGQPGGTNSIDQGINAFFTALQDLANSPTVSSKTSAVNAAVSLANQVSGLANSLQSLRLQSDSDINAAVNKINTDLETLATTNTALERAAATNQPTGGLLDQRDTALNDIAQYIDIKPTYQLDGEVTVNTGSGLTLLTPTNSSKLLYSPVTSVQSLINNANFSPLQIQTLDPGGKPLGPPVTLVTGGQSADVTTSLISGKIKGLLSMRDSTIPNLLSQLDGLAANLRDAVNAVGNQGTSFPPPNSYTGQRLTTGAANATQWSGDLQIAVLDASGKPVPSPYADEANGVPPLTLDLGALQGSGGSPGLLTTDDIINAINQYYGTPQTKVELGNLNNVQLGLLSNNVPDTGNTLSFDFNLNNISGNSGNFFVTGMSVLANGVGAPVATLGSGVSTTEPTLNITGYQSNAANTVTVQAGSTAGLSNGETIYINAASAPVVDGVPLASGFYKIQNVTGTSFDISLAGTSGSGVPVAAGASDTALPPITNVSSGQTLRTGSNGSFTVSGITSPAPAFYTVQANIATIDASGNVVTSTVSYNVPNNTANVLNNLVGANSLTGGGTLVQPNTVQPLVTATLVDANGNPLPKVNGSYGNQQGYLKITANNSSYTVAINELNSQQLGLPNASTPKPGTNQGFSQYFGLNNIFNVNDLTTTGDTTANSAVNLSVVKSLLSNPGLISTGTLSPGLQPAAGSGSPPNFTYIMAPGDNSISQKLAAIATATQSFAAVGGMAASNTTLSQYAGQVIAVTSNDSTNATNTANDAQTLLSGFTQRAQSVSGVNLDQELANTVIYQNAYSASTRVITVVATMFNDLLGIIQ